MTTVNEIREFINTLAPEATAAEWDHVGLLCGRGDREVRRVLVALDASMAACREAKARDCRLLLTHHPALFSLDAVSDATPTGRILLYLIENGISAVNAHTNLDFAVGGVNDCLAARLELTDAAVIDPMGTDAQGRPYGLLRGGSCAERTPEEFVRFVKTALACEGVRWVSGGKPVRRVAVGGGSCADALARVASLGFDAFVTADVKYHAFCDAEALGVTLVDAGHFETENPVCAYLTEQLRAAFPNVEFLTSETHKDCIKFA